MHYIMVFSTWQPRRVPWPRGRWRVGEMGVRQTGCRSAHPRFFATWSRARASRFRSFRCPLTAEGEVGVITHERLNKWSSARPPSVCICPTRPSQLSHHSYRSLLREHSPPALANRAASGSESTPCHARETLVGAGPSAAIAAHVSGSESMHCHARETYINCAPAHRPPSLHTCESVGSRRAAGGATSPLP